MIPNPETLAQVVKVTADAPAVVRTGFGGPGLLADLAARCGAAAALAQPLGATTWYRVGGPAALTVTASHPDQLGVLSEAVIGTGLPVMVVGEGSNLLVADRGFDGVVLRLDRGAGDGFGLLDATDRVVTVGGAVRMPDLARWAADHGLAGLEWMAGIPGSVGGAVRMNAGVARDTVEVRHRILDAVLFDLHTGTARTHTGDELAFAYRRSAVRGHQVVVSVRFALEPGDPERIRAENARHLEHRRTAQETVRTAGSVFTNPDPEVSDGASAWQLIERAGCGGLRVGTASVSTRHANFFLADRDGFADDMYALMVEVRRRVHRHTGVLLHAETCLVGFPPLIEVA